MFPHGIQGPPRREDHPIRVTIALAAEFPLEPFPSLEVAKALDSLGIGWGLPPLVPPIMEPRPDHLIWAWPVVEDPLDAVPEPRPRLRAAFDGVLGPSLGMLEPAARRRCAS